MKYISILIALFLFSTPVLAQRDDPVPPTVESGIFYDADRDGEGIVVTADEDGILFYFYTYHPDYGCWNSKDPDCSDQRFFVSTKEPLIRDTYVIGDLYTTVGTYYPECVGEGPKVSPASDRKTCGVNVLIGEFFLSRIDGGWALEVDQEGDFLPEDDPLYETTYEFDTPLMYGTE